MFMIGFKDKNTLEDQYENNQSENKKILKTGSIKKFR